jgi:hypothetical protein
LPTFSHLLRPDLPPETLATFLLSKRVKA